MRVIALAAIAALVCSCSNLVKDAPPKAAPDAGVTAAAADPAPVPVPAKPAQPQGSPFTFSGFPAPGSQLGAICPEGSGLCCMVWTHTKASAISAPSCLFVTPQQRGLILASLSKKAPR